MTTGSALRRGGYRQALLLELFVDHLGEGLERLGAVEEPAVDEKSRRAGDSQGLGFRRVRVDDLLVVDVQELLLELGDVEPDVPGVALEGVELEVLLLGEKLVVELPELTLLGRHR